MVLISSLNFYLFFLNAAASCILQDFESSQLRSDSFHQEQNLSFSDQYSFGVWTMYAPLRKNSYSNKSKTYFNQALPLDGFHILNFKIADSINLIYYQKSVLWTIYPTQVIILLTQTGLFSYSFQYHPFYFEGYWVFTYFGFNSKNQVNFASYNIGEDGYFNYYFTSKKLIVSSSQRNLEYGGHGEYKISSISYNFFNFLGRISNIITFDTTDFFFNIEKSRFLQFISKCQIPSGCSQAKEIKIFNEVYNTKNITNFQYQLDLTGLRFYMEFWLKRNLTSTTSEYELVFSYGSQFYNQAFYKRILVYIRRVRHTIVMMHKVFAFYYFPSEDDSDYLYQYNIRFTISEDILSSWNFFRYEFHRNDVYEKVYMYLYTSSNDVSRKYYLLYQPYKFQYSNYQAVLSFFSEIVEYNTDTYIPFQGYLANFRIYYCYSGDQVFGKQFGFNCHPKCKTCVGPTEFDCDSCYSEQNRILVADLKICLCQFGYKQVDSLICEYPLDFHNEVMIQNNIISTQRCLFGYFEFWIGEIFQFCIRCPYYESNSIFQFCLNCLNNQKHWYQNPICNNGYQTKDGYNFYKKEYIQDAELYFINKNLKTAEICRGCDQEVQQWNEETIVFNLEKQNFFKCKQNMINLNNTCVICQYNCQVCDKKTKLCNLCNQGYYLQNLNCIQCPEGCNNCAINQNKNKISCFTCQIGYANIQDGCERCGLYCNKCITRVNSYTNKSYLKCIECQNNRYISLDGESCYENKLDYCLSTFQFSMNDFKINTNFFEFEPIEQQYIKTGCLQCQSHTYLEQISGTYVCTPLEFESSIKGCYQSINIDVGLICTLGNAEITQLSKGYCTNHFSQCKYCLPFNMEYIGLCLQCEDGYYNDYYSTFCKKCPDTECSKCYQSDYSKIQKAQSFMIFILSLPEMNPTIYKKYTQEKDEKYVKIYCQECIDGFILYEEKCIPECPMNCLKCEVVNFQQLCIACRLLDEDSRFQLLDGKCLKCPQNCQLCSPRDLDNKKQINPYFDNEVLDFYSNQCIKPINDQFFYDTDINQFIDCDGETTCQKEVSFFIDIICNQDKLEEKQNDQMQKYFINMFNFSDLENYDFYKYLNDQFVKKITITYLFQKNSYCVLTQDLILETKFQQNIFNLIDIQFNLDGQNSTLIFENSLQFYNLSGLSFQNFNFQIDKGGLKVQSLTQYTFKMENIIISQSEQKQLSFEQFIKIYEASKIIIEDLYITTINLQNVNGIISIINQKFQNQIQISRLSFDKSHIKDSIIFQIIQDNFIELKLINFSFIDNSVFNTLMLFGVGKQFNFYSNNFIFKNTIITESYGFINISNAMLSEINYLEIEQLILSDSNFFIVSRNCNIKDLTMSSSSILGENSKFILHQNLLNLDTGSIKLEQISFIQIIYSEKNNLIEIINSQNTQFKVIIQQIHISDVSIKDTLSKINDYQQKSFFESLIYLENVEVIFINSQIQRGVGMPELTIKNSNFVRFDNNIIKLNDKYQYKSLYIQTSCQEHFVSPIFYDSFIVIEDIQMLNFENNIFQNLIIFDTALIKITQSINIIPKLFKIINNTFSQIILHQQYYYTKITILLLNSIIPTPLIIEQNIYELNFLNIISENLKNKQGLVFTIESSKSTLNLNKNKFLQNMIQSNSSTLLFVDCLDIEIKDSLFYENSFFSFSNIKNFIYWNIFGDITLTRLEQFFIQSSQGGNGQIQCQYFRLINTTIQNSQVKNGGGFKLDIINDGVVEIYKSQFENLYANQFQESNGGFLYITTTSNKLSLKIINCKFKNIISNLNGGVIYIYQPALLTDILLVNSSFFNVNSLQGSIFYQDKTTQISQQTFIQMDDCNFHSEKESLISFLNNHDSISNSETNSFINDFSLLYCKFCKIKITNISFYNIPYIQLFYFSGPTFLRNIIIQNSTFVQSLIQFKIGNQQFDIFIKNLVIINCTQLQNLQDIQDNQQNNETLNIKIECSEKILKVPSIIPQGSLFVSNKNYQQFIQFIINYAVITQKSAVIFFENMDSSMHNTIKIQGIQIENVQSQSCQFGVLSFYQFQDQNITIKFALISNSNCGKFGCISIISPEKKNNHSNNYELNHFSQLTCLNNKAELGGCIYLENFVINLNNSIIKQNVAKLGGGIHINGSYAGVLAEKVQIIENLADIGGGIYSEKAYVKSEKGILFGENFALNYSDEIQEPPQKLSLRLFNKNPYVIPLTLYKTSNLLIETPLSQNSQQEIFYVPTGLKLNSYQIFNEKENRYETNVFNFEIIALNSQNQQLINLQNSYCNLDLLDYDNNEIKYPNLLSQKQLLFDDQTNSYNLKDQIFYLPQIQKKYILQVSCNLVQIPIINNSLVLQYHQNYYLNIVLLPKPCQLGEIRSNINDYCHLCNVELNQYSVTYNSSSCQILDEQKIQNFTSAQINLKMGFWRHKLTSFQIDECLNKQSNCIGGWESGNDICREGHLCALCEQCDYYNERGDGNYYRINQFDCDICSSNQKFPFNLIIITIIFVILFLIFHQISISTKDQLRKALLLTQCRHIESIFLTHQISVGQMIKITIQYFQIVSLIQEFKTILSDQFQYITNYIGNPFETLRLFSNCQLIYTQISIQYTDILQQFSIFLIILTILATITIFLLILKKIRLTKSSIFNVFYYCYFFLIISAQQSLAKQIGYRFISNNYYIYQNVCHTYKSSNHIYLTFIIFLPILILIGFIIPIFIYLQLQEFNKTKKFSTRIIFGFWFLAYNPKKEFWELFKISAYSFFVIFSIIIDLEISFKVVLFYFILILIQQIANASKILYSKRVYNLEQSLTIICMLILFCSYFSFNLIEPQHTIVYYMCNSFYFISLILIFYQILQNYQVYFKRFYYQFLRIVKKNYTFSSINTESLSVDNMDQKKIRIQQAKKIMMTNWKSLSTKYQISEEQKESVC